MLNRQETIINFSPGEDTASIFTSEPRIWAKVESLQGFELIRTEKLKGRVVAKEFTLPRAFIRFGKGGLRIGPPKAVSQVQREQGRVLAKM